MIVKITEILLDDYFQLEIEDHASNPPKSPRGEIRQDSITIMSTSLALKFNLKNNGSRQNYISYIDSQLKVAHYIHLKEN